MNIRQFAVNQRSIAGIFCLLVFPVTDNRFSQIRIFIFRCKLFPEFFCIFSQYPYGKIRIQHLRSRKHCFQHLSPHFMRTNNRNIQFPPSILLFGITIYRIFFKQMITEIRIVGFRDFFLRHKWKETNFFKKQVDCLVHFFCRRKPVIVFFRHRMKQYIPNSVYNRIFIQIFFSA